MLIAIAVIASLLAIALMLLVIGGMVSHRSLANSASELLSEGIQNGQAGVITESDIAHLPDPVQRWLRASNAVGAERVSTVRLRQTGRFRQTENGQWMPFNAVQYYSVDPPAFVWRARFDMAGLPLIEVRDSYIEGEGKTRVRAAYVVPFGSESGPEVDQGDLLRFLNETMWFPSAALSDYIQWEPIESDSARATMTYGRVTASAVFEFNENGDLVDMSAQRFGKFDGGYSLETWTTPIQAHADFGEFRLPSHGTGIWELESGNFSYIELEIAQIDYNVSEPY